MSTTRKGPGSHNRISRKVIAHHEKSRNLTGPCACILHRKRDKNPSVLALTEFNRQGTGHQSMCRTGKTLIDAIKHKFWRIASAAPLVAYQESAFPCSIWSALKGDDFLRGHQAQEVIAAIESHPSVIALRTAAKSDPDFETVFRAGQAIENGLTLRALGFYEGLFDDANEAREKFSEFNQRLLDLTSAELLKELEEPLDELIDTSEKSLYVKESSQADSWNEIAVVGKNWSKRNDIYEVVDGTYKKIGYRGPFHNTISRASAESGSRLVRYLVEIDRTDGPREVNRWIVSERPAGYHADHIMPLALGGRHTKKNIRFVPDGENLQKKDRLTFSAYKELTSDVAGLVGMINKDALPIVIECIERIGHDEAKFNEELVYITALLRDAMSERRERVARLSRSDGLKFVQKIRPDLNSAQAERFLDRFLRGWNI